MNRPPRNAYTPGLPLPPALHAIGRPVTFFDGHRARAGTIISVSQGVEGETFYDIHVTGGGTYYYIRLGTLMNPQPNTFVFAP